MREAPLFRRIFMIVRMKRPYTILGHAGRRPPDNQLFQRQKKTLRHFCRRVSGFFHYPVIEIFLLFSTASWVLGSLISRTPSSSVALIFSVSMP